MFYGREIERKKLCTMFQTDGQISVAVLNRIPDDIFKNTGKRTAIQNPLYFLSGNDSSGTIPCCFRAA